MDLLARLLFAAAAFALLVEVAQLLLAARFLSRPGPQPSREERISVLKPLRGIDDGLGANLQSFLDQDYPAFELLLGAADEGDPAWRLARALERQHPGKVRAVLQRGEPGLNPKVNQLCTLAAEARGPWVVISDSNVEVGRDYLRGIAALLADERVGLVTHPVAGVGGARLGSRLDNLQTASVFLGVVSVKAALDQDIVVGKSMALRKADVEALGGFAAYADVLAEDFLIGRDVGARLGKRVAVAGSPVRHVTGHADLRAFWRRFARWSVMQRRTVGLAVYASQILLNPVALALAAALVRPSLWALALLAAASAARATLDGLACALASGGRVPARAGLLAPLKDLLVASAWAYGLVVDRIDWRGRPLRVAEGSRLVRADAPEAEAAALPAGR